MTQNKISRLLVISVPLLLAGISPPIQAEGIDWQSDYVKAREIARHQGKPLLVHFWSESCGPCKKLDQYVFPHPDVARTVNGVVAVKVNTRQQRQLAQQFGIKRIPTDVLIAPDGRELARGLSPSTVNAYIAMINRAVQLHRTAPDRSGLSQLADVARHRDPYFVGQTGYASHNGSSQPDGVGDSSRNPPPTIPRAANFNPEFRRQAENLDSSRGGSFQAGGGEFQQPHQPNRTQGPTPDANRTAGVPQSHSRAAEPSNNPYFGQQDPRMHNRHNLPPSPAQSEQVRQIAPKPKFALQGFCPVSLVEERRWAKGDPRWGVVHRGQTYVFASEANAKKFWTDPDAYSPMLSGYDPVKFAEHHQWIEGNRQFGVFYKDQYSGRTSIVLFADEDALQRFWREPSRYSGQVQQALRLDGQPKLR